MSGAAKGKSTVHAYHALRNKLLSSVECHCDASKNALENDCRRAPTSEIKFLTKLLSPNNNNYNDNRKTKNIIFYFGFVCVNF